MKTLILLTLLCISSVVRAESVDEVRRGGFLPYTTSPVVNKDITALTFSSYNSIGDVAQLRGIIEANLVGPLVLHTGAVYYSDSETFRPRVGLKVQLLDQRRHAVNGAIMALYKPEGFTEAEGELEFVAAVSRQFSNVTLVGNLVYGQDFEATEQDGEVNFAALYQISAKLHTGLDTKFRVNLGQKPNLVFDLVTGPLVGYSFSHLTLLLQSGVSIIYTARASEGIIVLGGAGLNF